MKIYRYTEFKSNPFGHGAEKRTAQIGEILANAGLDFEIIINDESLKINPSILIKKSINHFIFILQIFNINTFKNIKIFLKFVYKSIKAEGILSNKINTGNDLLFWEFTRSNCFYIPALASKMKIRAIAIPHNIESLVPNQCSAISGIKAPDWFSEEIKYLSFCDLVFCISKEDANLLSLFGINAFYLPYYPVREVERALLRIRRNRKEKNNESKKRKILMFGSADNQPTRLGMIDRIEIINQSTFDNIELIIAGFNTELLINEADISTKILLLGTISNDQLEKLLVEVDMILIHQPPTTGALTKIPEMLIAGIPILANFSSARNYYNTNGLYIYDNDTTFHEILNLFNLSIPAIPEKPMKERQFFIDKVNLLNA